ncbi:Light-harvesting complex-like protein OHP2, chloroplastic, partial [Linum perenne]
LGVTLSTHTLLLPDNTPNFFPTTTKGKTQQLTVNDKLLNFLQQSATMSVASSFPCINLRNPSPCSSAASPSTSATATSSTSASFRFSPAAARPYYHGVIIRASQAEGPIRRPVAPPLRQPSPPLRPAVPPSPPSSSNPPPPSSPPPKISAAQLGVAGDKGVVTLEFQRQKAKELQQYFKQKKLEEANQGPFFGFIPKNEISNGRMGDVRFRCWVADRVCYRLRLCCSSEDPFLQFRHLRPGLRALTVTTSRKRHDQLNIFDASVQYPNVLQLHLHC